MWLDAALDKEDLTTPKLRAVNLMYVHYSDEEGAKLNTDVALAPQPFAVSPVFEAEVTTVYKSTRVDGKEFYRLNLQAPEIEKLCFEPGDTIGILSENSDDAVHTVLQCTRDRGDAWIRIVSCDSKLNYLPETTKWTQLLKHYVNFKSIPQKNFLTALAEDLLPGSKERRLVEVLSSKEGADMYRKLILAAGVTTYDVITNLHQPCDVITLVKYLPRLLARPYSIASSPLHSPTSITIALSVLPEPRTGICTKMLRDKLSERGKATVKMFLRKSQGFRLPEDTMVPLILVGPGTGIAPYIGFLQHRKHCKSRGRILLFTGFSTKKDFLFAEEVNEHLESGVLTNLFVSYSREPNETERYVQDLIKKQWQQLGEVLDSGGVIYECGDFKVMKHIGSIADAFTHALKSYYDIDENEARDKIKSLKKEKRYFQDIWC